jgi:thioredoxin-related protein
MKKVILILGLIASIVAISMTSKAEQGPYDPSRDAVKDFQEAQLQAQNEDKLILIQIGGNWCPWCHKLERFFNKNDNVNALLDETFIPIKVNVSPENDNEAFLNEMPEFEGYPFIVITDAQGEILNSRTSGALEEGNGYSETKFIAYFKYWNSREYMQE